ncbi:MAG: helix-turn-helix domain-containing protein [Streptosporangiales bacterium]|nr:helix-turn-helix domain-containing protein [Streptosporangiales bacterium]
MGYPTVSRREPVQVGRASAASAASASPPTDRVVAVVELLAAGPADAYAASEVARMLGLNRSTATAVLSALEAAAWVRRLPDRRYSLGPQLLTVAEGVRARLPEFGRAEAVIRSLAGETGYGCALSRAEGEYLTVVALHRGRGRVPAGVTPGTRFRLRAPAGAAVVAWRSDADRETWLRDTPQRRADQLRRFLTTIRSEGVGVWRLEPGADTDLLELLGQVAAALAADPTQRELRTKVLAILGSFSTYGYRADELASARTVPVSYLVTPVFDAAGEVRYELQMGILRPDVPKPELEGCIRRLRAAGEALSSRVSFR